MAKIFEKSDRRKTGGLAGIPALAVIVAFGFGACGGGPRTTEKQTETTSAKLTFTPPTVPSAISDDREKVSYLVLHWWDNFDFSDTTCVHNPDVTERAFADFIHLLPAAGGAKIPEAIRRMLSKAEAEESGRVYAYLLDQAEKYLYDANSPFRDEELYVPFLEYVLHDARSGETERIRPAYQLEEINKNRRGTVATDFAYTLGGGRKGRLHAIRAEYTLLYFYNPDCSDCKRTKEVLQHSEAVVALVDAGKLKILALYPDEDVAIWEASRLSMPPGWINARDGSPGQAVKSELYSIRAIPSLYLLDSEKRVVLKDATAEQAVGLLEHIFQNL